MGRYISEENQVVGFFESGLYATKKSTGSTFWIGQVTANSVDDSEGKVAENYIGNASRSFSSIDQGVRDVTGTISYKAQDMRLPFWSIGSVQDYGSSGIHVVTEIPAGSRHSAFTSGLLNPPISFTLEDSKQTAGTGTNFIRTINGCVPSNVTINMAQGEKVSIDIDWIGQTLTYSSGTVASVTEDTSNPYLWSAVSITAAGSTLQTVKDASFVINQNVEGPHYLNGSRDISVPYFGQREYTLNLTLDFNSLDSKMLYEEFYKNNTSFNAVLDLNQDSTTGSQHTVFIMSGCKVMTMDIPTGNEGVNEATVEIRPKSVTGSAWDNTNNYNPW